MIAQRPESFTCYSTIFARTVGSQRGKTVQDGAQQVCCYILACSTHCITLFRWKVSCTCYMIFSSSCSYESFAGTQRSIVAFSSRGIISWGLGLEAGNSHSLIASKLRRVFYSKHSDCDESVNVKLSILTEHLSRLLPMCHDCAGKNNHQSHEPLHHTIT